MSAKLVKLNLLNSYHLHFLFLDVSAKLTEIFDLVILSFNRDYYPVDKGILKVGNSENEISKVSIPYWFC